MQDAMNQEDCEQNAVDGMGVDQWVDRGSCSPYFLKWRGRLVFYPATSFFGGGTFKYTD